MTPLFLFSLPRSGSTLLQRILAGHSQIATASEPWLLLPLAAMTGDPGLRVYADYSHRTSVVAFEDLVTRMPGGRRQILDSLGRAVQDVYRSVADREVRYFLDKTPRYFLIVDFVLELFPEAPAIVLLRNPLDVLASIISTWGQDRLWLHHGLVDLYRGPRRIHEAIRRHPKRLELVLYDSLVESPREVVERLCLRLGIPFESTMLEGGKGEVLTGRLGDKSVNSTRGDIVDSSVARWKRVLATPLRRAFARRYLRQLGPEILATFGQDMASLERELDALPVRWERTWSDAVALAGSFLGPAVLANVVRERWFTRRELPFTKLD